MVKSLIFSPTSGHPYYYNWRLILDEDDNGKFRLEWVNDTNTNVNLLTSSISPSHLSVLGISEDLGRFLPTFSAFRRFAPCGYSIVQQVSGQRVVL